MSKLSLALLACLLPATPLVAQDDDDSKRGARWFIDVTYKKLAPITLREGRGRARTFWYVLLELKNKTGKDRKLDLTAHAKTPQVKRKPVARPGLYPNVTQAIAKRHKLKKLENLLNVEGTLGDGDKKHVVIVFPALSNLANKIDVRVSGLTNMLYQEGKTVWREDTELSIKFHRVGDEFDTTRNRIIDKGKSWITERRTKVRG